MTKTNEQVAFEAWERHAISEYSPDHFRANERIQPKGYMRERSSFLGNVKQALAEAREAGRREILDRMPSEEEIIRGVVVWLKSVLEGT